jgi:hypothetical protein
VLGWYYYVTVRYSRPEGGLGWRKELETMERLLKGVTGQQLVITKLSTNR